MNNIKTIAVITARGGSQRLPLKNLMDLAGKPLVAWCIGAALDSQKLDRVIVSTDHDGIASVAIDAGAEAPFLRPQELAGNVPSEKVVQHAVDYHETETGRVVEIVVTLQPTTPFISGEDIDGCIAALDEYPMLSAAVSVSAIHERPEWMMRRLDQNGVMKSFMNTVFSGDTGVSQRQEQLFIPNGGIYATRRQTLFGQNSLYGDNYYGHVMGRLRSVDIDELIDFRLAETIARYPSDF